MTLARTVRRTATTLLAAMSLVGLGAIGNAASAATLSCAPFSYSPTGHSVNTTCYSGPGTKYAIQAQACNSGGCTLITSAFVRYTLGNSLNAGSAYITSGSAKILTAA